MEATNKGAFEGGGMAVGLNIDLPREQPSSRYQHISLRFKHFFARKVMFAKFASAYIVLPGGYGTLDELFEALTLVQTGKGRQMPIILVHEPFWRGLLEWIQERLVSDEQQNPLADPATVYASLAQILCEGPSKTNPARLTGRTRSNKIVVYEGVQTDIGQLIELNITHSTGFSLSGVKGERANGCDLAGMEELSRPVASFS
jgi:hypothetical protein